MELHLLLETLGKERAERRKKEDEEERRRQEKEWAKQRAR